MQVIQLSENGYRVKDVFDLVTLDKICDLCKTTDMLVDCDGREKATASIELRLTVSKCLSSILSEIVPKFKLGGIELWRDPPGYTNAYHYDDPALKNVIIIYLDTHPDPSLGTGYVEDNGVEYRVEYTKNNAIILLNSNKVYHGLVGKVPAGVTRYTIYANWIELT